MNLLCLILFFFVVVILCMVVIFVCMFNVVLFVYCYFSRLSNFRVRVITSSSRFYYLASFIVVCGILIYLVCLCIFCLY